MTEIVLFSRPERRYSTPAAWDPVTQSYVWLDAPKGYWTGWARVTYMGDAPVVVSQPFESQIPVVVDRGDMVVRLRVPMD